MGSFVDTLGEPGVDVWTAMLRAESPYCSDFWSLSSLECVCQF